MEGAAPAALPRLVLACRAASSARRRCGARALAPVGASGGEDAEALRAPALGNGRRARATGALGRAEAGAPGAGRALPVGGARAGSARARRARRSRRPDRVSRFPRTSGSRTTRRTPSSSAACRRRRGFSTSSRRRRASRASSSATGRFARASPMRSGFVPPSEVGAYYERAAVVVCPSHREGYGVAAREAMAHGRPVVASAVGGLLDAVEDGVTGMLVPPRDPVALRAAVETLLDDSELRRRLGDGGPDDRARAVLVGRRDRCSRCRVSRARWRA